MKYGKSLEYYLKQNARIRIFFLSNSTNVALLLSTITVSYARIEKWKKVSPYQM